MPNEATNSQERQERVSRDRQRFIKPVAFGWACYVATSSEYAEPGMDQITFKNIGLAENEATARQWLEGDDSIEIRKPEPPTSFEVKLS